MVLFVSLAVAAIFLTEGMPLIKTKEWKELFTLGVLLIIALFLIIGDKLGIPDPVNIMKGMITPIGKNLFSQSSN
jgi:hypothetical protein